MSSPSVSTTTLGAHIATSPSFLFSTSRPPRNREPNTSPQVTTLFQVSSICWLDILFFETQLKPPIDLAEEKLVIDVGDYEVFETPRGPSMLFSESIIGKLRLPWRNDIIIKFVGKSHKNNFIQSRLKQKWNLKTPMQLDLDYDFFISRFALELNLQKVITRGPWVVAGHYVAMQHWRSGFDATTEQINRLTVWVRLTCMYVEHLKAKTVKTIGDLLGTTYKVDAHTVG
ncbi:unnamed protein product [Prunus armeniaca]